ncbi:MAG: hypothetical protein COB98_09715 [Flavobacteriaceae bacterium]|nr:MAG: hypothetical protein COB98_09715 [Flavobacteriaceae bacterium]
MNKFDKIGIAILILGFRIGLPIYIIGIIIFFFGTLKLKHKLSWILSPLILFFPIFKTVSSISYYFSDIQKVDLFLPAGFKGKKIIIDNTHFGQKNEKRFRRE